MTRPDVRLPRDIDHPWHVAINGYDAPHGVALGGPGFNPAGDAKSFMYEAKSLCEEVPRLALLFQLERTGKLPGSHRQCSHSASEPVPDNHLTCCLGVECRACPHLAVIDRVQTRRDYEVRPSGEVPIPDEQRDVMKAWTCATHILMRGGDTAREGYILTTDDRMYWQNLYASLAGGDPGESEEPL